MPTTAKGWLPRLRAATEAQHDALDELPVAVALSRGDPTPRELATFLWIMALLHAATERACADVRDETLRELGAELRARGRAAERDLAALADAPVESAAMRPVTAIAEAILWRAKEDPRALLGALYVLQGSRRGARVLADRLEAQHPGLSFFASAAEDQAGAWRRLCAALDATDPCEASGACELAAALFGALIDALGALVTPPNHVRPTAMVLNNEAGAHAIVTAPRPLVAALSAGLRCWRDFPYLEERYGARGRCFTGSDSAWLATLAGATEEAALTKIRWLGRLLAARGLPTLILETHVVRLVDELAAFADAEPAALAPLAAAAQALRDDRAAHLDDADARALEASFAAAVGARDPFATPALVVAAVADECSDHERAVSSLTDWLADEARFGLRWSTAVLDLVDAARDRAR
ncbi:MAG: biliverdin-producing heme oxygenase [Nannocystaceae bacterium]